VTGKAAMGILLRREPVDVVVQIGSCFGVGLSRDYVDFAIPLVIVMKIRGINGRPVFQTGPGDTHLL
jgi:hypothetical protein